MVVEKKDLDSNSHEANIAPKCLNELQPFPASTATPEKSTTNTTLCNGDDLPPEPCLDSCSENLIKINGTDNSITNSISNTKSTLESEEDHDSNKHLKYEKALNNKSSEPDVVCLKENLNEQEMSIESSDSSDIKIQLSDNEVEIGDIDSGLDLDHNKIDLLIESQFSDALNQSDSTQPSGDEEGIQLLRSRPVISVKLADLKSNFSEFEDFMRLYLYINQVNETESSFSHDSMELFFTTNDEAFNSIHNLYDNSDIIYNLPLVFGHEIIPENCYVKQIKKKSIEIHLAKAAKITWGSIGISPSSTSPSVATTKSDSNLNEKYLPNKWTPCAAKSEGYSSNSYSNNLQLVKYEPPIEFDSFTSTDRGRFYGYTGLDNLGNTCFMNSVLQCLSNTGPLRDYFLSKHYVNDINKSNPLGHGGVIVEAFAQFLRQLWMGKQSSLPPTRLKSLIGEKITSMFMGFNQHDAQEFMSFFLDAIHEDLNRNENKPKIDYKKSNDSDEKELFDEDDFICEKRKLQMENLLKEKAFNMWTQYRLFNNSIVIDLFYGQFKSILTCPDCCKKSIMFDPFLYVPLPIPPPKIKYEVIFFSRDQLTGMCSGSTHYALKLSNSAAASELMNMISLKANVSTKSMRLIQQQEEHMPPKFLNPNWLLSDYSRSSFTDSSSSRNRPLLLFEVFKDENEEYLELCIIQRSLEKLTSMSDSRIGFPFIVSLKKSKLTYSNLCAVLCSYASHSVSAYRPTSTECFSGAISSTKSNPPPIRAFHTDLFSSEKRSLPFDMNNSTTMPRLVYFKCSSLQENEMLSPFVLRTPNFNGPFVNTEEEEITPLIISEIEESCPSDDSDVSEESQSTLINSSNEEENESLEDESFDETCQKEQHVEETNAERIFKYAEFDNDSILDLGNLFYLAMDWIDIRNYPKISIKWFLIERKMPIDLSIPEDNDVSLDECLRLFNEPEVLGPQNCWRCPFCKELREATKQLSFWRLPPILVIQLKRFKMRNVIYRDKISQLVKYPINGLDLSKYQNGDCAITCSNGEKVKPVYDLYAVVNHLGDAFMGHYTAFARSFDGELGWRHFDDCSVENVDESCVITSNAYLLFYKCRWSDERNRNSTNLR